MPQPFTHIGNKISRQAVQITPNGSGQRMYQTPEGNRYPSITTVMNLVTEDIITAWKKAVGPEVAEKESRYALRRGSVIHEMVEHYLNNEKEIKVLAGQEINFQMIFKQLKPLVNQIDRIRAQETALYSDLFRVGGRCDCIADYKGRLSIIDFKGSKKEKSREDIPQYFMQTAFYAYAFYELTGVKIPQCVILMANEKGGVQEFIESPRDWWEPLKYWRKKYEDRYGV